MIFQLIAITIFIIFYGCYFVKMIRQKKKGIQTDQIGKGKVGFVKFVEVTMKIAAILVFTAGLVSILAGTDADAVPVRILGAAAGEDAVPVRILGAVAGATGTAVFMVAVQTMRDSWRAGVPREDKTELVTRGIYQMSRNPAFLGFDLLYIGILMMFFNWILCIFTVFAIFMYHLQIVYVEEVFLTVTFGEEYLQYKKKVCRYLGRKVWRRT